MQLDVIHNTDALSGFRMLSDESVDCVVTSPPYWQMRDYGIAPTLWVAIRVAPISSTDMASAKTAVAG